MPISLCLSLKSPFKSKRIMLKDSLHKLLGSPNQEKVISTNLLQLDQQVKPSCILPMPIGLKVIETFPSNSTSGLIQSDGSSNIQPPSSELENFYGRRVTLLMQLTKKPKKKCTTTQISTSEFTNKFQLFQFVKVLRHNLKNSQEDSEPQLQKLGFPKTEELFKLPLVITQAKILPRCSESSSKTRRNKRNSSGKLVGD